MATLFMIIFAVPASSVFLSAATLPHIGLPWTLPPQYSTQSRPIIPPLFHVSMYRLSHCLAPFTRSCASALPPSPAPAARIEYGLLYSAFRPTLFKHIALASSETCMYVDCRNIRTQHDLVLLDELRLRDPLVGVSCSCGRVSWRCIACMRWHMYRIAVGPVGPTPSGRVCE